jgi:putative cardiolipin synthase
MRLNTEMGLVIESTRLAEAIMKEFDRVAMQSAYEVVLTPDGRELHWVERTPDGEVRHRTEPETHWLRRLVIAVIALLPIEGLL